MPMKRYFILFPLMLTCNILIALSSPRVLIFIQNSSSIDIVVNMEFWYGPESNPDPIRTGNMWRQTIFNIPLSVHVLPAEHRTRPIPPGQEMNIIRYNVPFMLFDRIVDVSFVDMMSATFKKFVITNVVGEKLFTLEHLEEIVIERGIATGVIWYVLEIFDPEAEDGTQNPPGEGRVPPYWFLEFEAQRVDEYGLLSPNE